MMILLKFDGKYARCNGIVVLFRLELILSTIKLC